MTTFRSTRRRGRTENVQATGGRIPRLRLGPRTPRYRTFIVNRIGIVACWNISHIILYHIWREFLTPLFLSWLTWRFENPNPLTTASCYLSNHDFRVTRYVALGAQQLFSVLVIPSRELPKPELSNSGYRFTVTAIPCCFIFLSENCVHLSAVTAGVKKDVAVSA